ncbi:MAG: TetR/AcrR family transcriptional regulator [Sphingomonadales bacterium]|nr:TetR/AcrR family transcriptional regulator [Sphingomonadales bacterium]
MSVNPNIAVPAPKVREGTRQRILRGARDCFQRLGIDKATIVDIAEAAAYSRPIIYKHFSDKADIVDQVCLEEMQALQLELNKRIARDGSYADQLTDAIFQGVALARGNIYIQRFMDDREAWARSQSEAGIVHRWVRERWAAFLARGQQQGILAADIDIGECVTWISMVQSLLLLRYAAEPVDDREMRRFVERFVVRPLLTRG